MRHNRVNSFRCDYPRTEYNSTHTQALRILSKPHVERDRQMKCHVQLIDDKNYIKKAVPWTRFSLKQCVLETVRELALRRP